MTFISRSAIITVQLNLGCTMFESIEIRRAANGFILVITTEDETREYVYDTSRKALRVIKEHLEFGNSKAQ